MTTSEPSGSSFPHEDIASDNPASSKPQRAFISGPIDTGASQAYFKEHYIPAVDAAVSRGDTFVIGPIPSGVDADALAYLLDTHNAATRITVFLTLGEENAWGNQIRSQGVATHVEGVQTSERDAAMTRESDYDILRWRTDKEARAFYGAQAYRPGHVTNTERNWRRRRGLPENPTMEEKADEERKEKEQSPAHQSINERESLVKKMWKKVAKN